MLYSDHPRVHYDKAQLAEVICQFRFPVILSIGVREPVDFQEAVRSLLPRYAQAKISLFIAVLRKIILLIPLAIILPRFMGVMGVYWAEPISDTISAATASVLFMLNIRKILSEESLAKIH